MTTVLQDGNTASYYASGTCLAYLRSAQILLTRSNLLLQRLKHATKKLQVETACQPKDAEETLHLLTAASRLLEKGNAWMS